MPQNRRKHPNSLPVAWFVRWVVIAFFLGTAGLSYVGFKNQFCATGDRIKALERELAELQTKNEVVRAKISSLASRSALQRRLNEGFIKMIPISDNRIVRINRAASQTAAGEIQPVANEGVAR